MSAEIPTALKPPAENADTSAYLNTQSLLIVGHHKSILGLHQFSMHGADYVASECGQGRMNHSLLTNIVKWLFSF